jgi:hypothetical protein
MPVVFARRVLTPVAVFATPVVLDRSAAPPVAVL